MKMHANEIEVGDALVRRLVADYFPGLAELPIRVVHSLGTVNAIYCAGLPVASGLSLRSSSGAAGASYAWFVGRDPAALPLR